MRFLSAVGVVVGVVALLLAGAAMPGTSATTGAAASVPAAIVVGGGPYINGCVVFSGGTIDCWGYNSYGQLGTGIVPSYATGFSSTPVAVKGISTAKSVSNGGNTTCALLSGGTVKCWGWNFNGALGNGTTTTMSLTPVAVKGISSAKAISTGGNTTCALLSGGAIDCWGYNVYGQLGNGTTGSGSPTPVAVKGITGAKAVSVGNSHACALLSGGAIDCWGNNGSGQLGDGPTPNGGGSSLSSLQPSSTPVAVKGISNAIAVSAGVNDSCAVVSGGNVECWGSDLEGLLGNGTTGVTGLATAVTGISGAKAVSLSGTHACALLSGGAIKCWGLGPEGQLGNGTTTQRSLTPVAVKGISTAVAVSTAGNDNCVLLSGHTVECWGAGAGFALGLGNGDATDHSTPVAVHFPLPIRRGR